MCDTVKIATVYDSDIYCDVADGCEVTQRREIMQERRARKHDHVTTQWHPYWKTPMLANFCFF